MSTRLCLPPSPSSRYVILITALSGLLCKDIAGILAELFFQGCCAYRGPRPYRGGVRPPQHARVDGAQQKTIKYEVPREV